ncbi:uncharacterized protein LOC131858978 [Cryptomeria japonica]|uniref:uncharacterized protein LOC131858978 n=1 Tax=Cryptomeria japonica TaxID=3369 RepID=UPI0027D9D0BA|nr:uncharacterized protein LOC131858978 [Cryptomeria japonica]
MAGSRSVEMTGSGQETTRTEYESVKGGIVARKANPKPKPITKVNNDKKGTNIVGSTASATNVGNILNSVIDTTHAMILSEIMVDDVKLHGKDLGPIVAGVVRKHLGPELESLMMVLKNAVYTQGFTGGIGSRSPSR